MEGRKKMAGRAHLADERRRDVGQRWTISLDAGPRRVNDTLLSATRYTLGDIPTCVERESDDRQRGFETYFLFFESEREEKKTHVAS